LNSIFTQIINGEIPCYKIAETDNCFAFLDINPNSAGHTLCIPKKEIDLIFDLENKDYQDLMNFSKKIAKALKKAVDCEENRYFSHWTRSSSCSCSLSPIKFNGGYYL
jgi:histidine triad (HIT) family protein